MEFIKWWQDSDQMACNILKTSLHNITIIILIVKQFLKLKYTTTWPKQWLLLLYFASAEVKLREMMWFYFMSNTPWQYYAHSFFILNIILLTMIWSRCDADGWSFWWHSAENLIRFKYNRFQPNAYFGYYEQPHMYLTFTFYTRCVTLSIVVVQSTTCIMMMWPCFELIFAVCITQLYYGIVVSIRFLWIKGSSYYVCMWLTVWHINSHSHNTTWSSCSFSRSQCVSHSFSLEWVERDSFVVRMPMNMIWVMNEWIAHLQGLLEKTMSTMVKYVENCRSERCIRKLNVYAFRILHKI